MKGLGYGKDYQYAQSTGNKDHSVLGITCPTVCEIASTITPRMREWKSGFANAWKKSNGSRNSDPCNLGGDS